MPTYQFKTPDGMIVEQTYSMAEAPMIGSFAVIDGVKCQRVASSGVGGAEQVATATHGYPYAAMSCPRNVPGWKETDSQGHPIIRSQRAEREFMARTGRKRD